MPRAYLVPIKSLIASVVLLSLLGCGQREPDPDELIHYVKNARVGGKVRRQWPAGQEYVDAVLRADAAYRSAIEGLRDARIGAYLWQAKDAEKWSDEAAVQARMETLLALVTNDAKKERREEWAALIEAADKVPADVDPSDAEAFTDRVWAALGWEREGEEDWRTTQEALIEKHIALYNLAPTKDGQLSDAAREMLAARWADAREAIAFELLNAKRNEAGADKRVTALQKEKAALREELRSRARTEADTRSLRAIEDSIDYQMARRKYFRDERKEYERQIGEIGLDFSTARVPDPSMPAEGPVTDLNGPNTPPNE